MISILARMGQSKYTSYLAPVDFEADLKVELTLLGITIIETHGRLFLCEGEAQNVAFAQDIWHEVEKVDYSSINNAALQLRERGKIWSHFSINNHRRAQLILEKVSSVKSKRYDFLDPIPTNSMGVFALLSENNMLVSKKTHCPLPFGEIHFNEDKINPPSRAYLKLWEVFTLYKIRPESGMKVIDVGSCPGGWTWVLQTIGCHVISVDKAPLAPQVAELPNIDFRQESAFGLKPQQLGKIDWFFSDIICYPDKLLELVTRFYESGLVDNFVCTIKFQAPTDFETMFKFKNIPGSQIIHLSCNKHEVTWINLKQNRL